MLFELCDCGFLKYVTILKLGKNWQKYEKILPQTLTYKENYKVLRVGANAGDNIIYFVFNIASH